MKPRWQLRDVPRAWWRRRSRAWWLGAAAVAITPKCALCLLAYAGLGAIFGPGGHEWCGGAMDTTANLSAAVASLGFTALVLLFAAKCCLPRRSPGVEPKD